MRFSSAIYTLMLVVALALTMSLSAFADEHNPVIGSVRTIMGSPNIVRGGDPHQASIGDHLFMGDTLLTTSKSSIGVIFRDDSVISLGPNSEIVIDEFVFEPAQKKRFLSLQSQQRHGTFHQWTDCQD